MFVDLHLHSCFSDGTCTPEEIARELQKEGIGLAALADHNTCMGYEPFQAACRERGIVTLRCMELDCIYDGRDIHILAYGFQPVGKLMTLADHSKRLLLEMSRDLIKKMSPVYPTLSLEEYDQWDYPANGGGWKGLHYLVHKKVTATLAEGMKFYREYDCDYSSYPFPSIKGVCQAIRDASGIPVLAHPANWLDESDPTALTGHLDILRGLGVGGIECYYPSHSPRMTATCLAYCSRHNLLVTSGSDSHGEFSKVVKNVEYKIGTVKTHIDRLRLGRLLPQAI